jgi:hypothetical protein
MGNGRDGFELGDVFVDLAQVLDVLVLLSSSLLASALVLVELHLLPEEF